jgi:excisionase family DNA binding protein
MTHRSKTPDEDKGTAQRDHERRCKPHAPVPITSSDDGKRPGEVQAYTVEQVAEMLHIGRDKVYYLLRTGQLRSIKIGKLRRITDRHLAEFVASLETPVK